MTAPCSSGLSPAPTTALPSSVTTHDMSTIPNSPTCTSTGTATLCAMEPVITGVLDATLPAPEVTIPRQLEAAHGLLHRLLPDHEHLFQLVLHPIPPPNNRTLPTSFGFFSVQVHNGKVLVEGTSGVELASGIHWFLKYFIDSSVTWQACGGLQLNESGLSPVALAELERRGRAYVERQLPHSYYQNIVTQSYSMAFWDWDRWEAEIDWMALHGVTLPLATVGAEYAWLRTFEQFGLCSEDLADFFAGPAFLAWQRMGNLQGYAGPLPLAYMEKQAELQKMIVQRMRDFGMTPVLPAFAGFIPRALAEKHPEAAITSNSAWCHFPPPFCCPLLLKPEDPLFGQIGSAFIRTQRELYGWDAKGFYAADTFNEMKPSSSDPAYLAASSAGAYAAMADADSSAVWLMQAWLFFSDAAFWQPPQVKALLSGVPKGRLILLDLFADEHAAWQRTESFYGNPFIWVMLHNFGGNSEMYGALSNVQHGLTSALASADSPMVGVGMAPEGIEQNPVVYTYMAELAYHGRLGVPLNQWVADYSRRRYAGCHGAGSKSISAAEPMDVDGGSDVAAVSYSYSSDKDCWSNSGNVALSSGAAQSVSGAWQLLLDTVYTCTDRTRATACDVPTSRPGLSRQEIVGWGLRPHLWYPLASLLEAWKLLLKANHTDPGLSSSSAYCYDLVDVSKEVLSKASTQLWVDIVAAYQAKNLPHLKQLSAEMLSLLDDMDRLLGSMPAFMLGPWLQSARRYAHSSTGPQNYGKAASRGNAAAHMLQNSSTGLLASPKQISASAVAEAHAAAVVCASTAQSTFSATARAVVTAIGTLPTPASPQTHAGNPGIHACVKSTSCSFLGTPISPALCQPKDLAEGAHASLHNPRCLPEELQRQLQLSDEKLASYYEWNSRRQLTIWGTSRWYGDSEVSDYANKLWSGLLSGFYRPRWALWLTRLQQDLELGRQYDAEGWRRECLDFTYAWVAKTGEALPCEPVGQPVGLSEELFHKYRPLVERAAHQLASAARL